jgi:hypothetical protein
MAVPRRPAAQQQQRDRLQARWLRAAELLAAGVRQAEVARQLEYAAEAGACATTAGTQGSYGWVGLDHLAQAALIWHQTAFGVPRPADPGRG